MGKYCCSVKNYRLLDEMLGEYDEILDDYGDRIEDYEEMDTYLEAD